MCKSCSVMDLFNLKAIHVHMRKLWHLAVPVHIIVHVQQICRMVCTRNFLREYKLKTFKLPEQFASRSAEPARLATLCN